MDILNDSVSFSFRRNWIKILTRAISSMRFVSILCTTFESNSFPYTSPLITFFCWGSELWYEMNPNGIRRSKLLIYIQHKKKYFDYLIPLGYFIPIVYFCRNSGLDSRIEIVKIIICRKNWAACGNSIYTFIETFRFFV